MHWKNIYFKVWKGESCPFRSQLSPEYLLVALFSAKVNSNFAILIIWKFTLQLFCVNRWDLIVHRHMNNIVSLVNIKLIISTLVEEFFNVEFRQNNVCLHANII